MAESAITLAIDKLVPLLTNEVKLLRGVHEEVAEIKDDLESIRAFLKDADSNADSEGVSEGVKVWIKQAREVAYHIEDVIDEYMLRVAQHRDQHGFVGFLSIISSLVTKMQPRHVIASEIQDIRKTLVNIKDRSEGFRFISSQKGASSSNIALNIILHDPRQHSFFIEEAELVGIKSQRDELISLLLSKASRRTVISVVGMGGVGKTTLSKKVYDDYRVKEHFRYHAWITVSQSYNKEELLRSILKNFYEAKQELFPESIATMDGLSLINELREYLRLERYLVVLDNVWEIGFWGDVEHALLDNDAGSRIFVTTRNKNVAECCKRSASVHIHQLEPLSQQEAWELFCKKAFKFDQFRGKCPEDLEELSHEIVRRCGGLPLAIVAIGGLLATKEKVIQEWQKLLGGLSSAMATDPYAENVIKILSLSYGDLSYHLKVCFLYFGIFPQDFSIKRRRLIQLWVAEGFIQERQGITLEEVAEEHLTELIHRSLVQVDQVSNKGMPKKCRVHDLVLDIILSKSKELSFSHVSSNCTTFEGIARHLSISNEGTSNPKGSSTRSQTRSIMVFTRVELQKPIIYAIFSKLKLLTTLDFEKCQIYHIPKGLGKLLHLRYFSLKDTLVSKLPKSMGKLRNLESLDLRGSLVEELPVKITRFPKLRHLLGDFKENFGLKIRGGIGHLEFLQTLFIIRMDDDDVRLVNEIGMLKQLRKLGIDDLKREQGRDLCTAIEKMTYLRSLLVASVNDILDVQSISPPPLHLQSLELVGKLERLPDWISKLHNLGKLRLGYSRLMNDPIKVIQALPSLKFFEIYCGYNGEQIHFQEGQFQKLKWLALTGLNRLNTVIIEKGAMPLLKELRIGSCPELSEVPSGIQHLKNLKNLSFAKMIDEFNQRLSSNEGEDYWIVKHVPILQYDSNYDPQDEISYGAYVRRHFG